MKIINTSDFHFSMEWEPVSRACGKAVADAAMKMEADLIVTSDWFDKPILATDKGGLRAAKEIMKSWLDICPVVAVEGTPSHDAPGCYGIFEDMGLMVLRPGEVYCYADDGGIIDGKIVEKIYDNSPHPATKAILFGFPELNKNNIQAKLNLPAEKANAEAVNLFRDYILEFVAPMRMKYADIPAFGILHGNVSDSSHANETDIILKASDIVIHTEDLEPAGLDYWFLGHIHKPWASQKIKASYPGSWGKTWGERDFLPAFEMMDFDHDCGITRIPYSTPERRKVDSASLCIDPAIAYWLTSGEELPETCHPWSKTTFEKDQHETRRVTREEAETAKTLWDLFLLFDPELSPDLKTKVDQIEETTRTEQHGEKAVQMTYLKVKGCSFFGGRTIEFDLSSLPETLTAITGENGDGKSSLLSFCSPYPIVIGKDTKSGRQSAIKDFFPDGGIIEKRFSVNGKIHKHVITVKSKTECYADIDGVPQLETATFDTLMEWAESQYGPFEDYRITTFYEQPQQSQKNQSGLMSAGRTEARNVVQNIAGIDREKEKRFALDKANAAEAKANKLSTKIETAEAFMDDPEKLKAEIVESEQYLEYCNDREKKLENEIKRKEKEIESAEEKNKILKEQIATKKRLCEEKAELNERGATLLTEKDSLLMSVSALKENRGKIKNDDEALKENEKIKEQELQYQKSVQEYQEAMMEHSSIEHKRDSLQSSIDFMNDNLKKLIPCEHCGKLPSTAEKEKEVLSFDIRRAEERLKELIIPDSLIVMIPAKIDFKYLPTLQNRAFIEDEIKEAETAETKVNQVETELSLIFEKIEKIDIAISEIKFIVADDMADILTMKKGLENLMNERSGVLIDQSTKIEKIRSLKENLQKAETQLAELKTDCETLVEERKKQDDWTTISRLLNPDKVPALELELVLDSIDEQATQNIDPFLDGRYSYRTITQNQGKKKAVDRFDILIHDKETGQEFSMFYVNPGNKAFYSDCYVKALISQRNKKMKRSYSPIISDEQDAPISPERVSMYYDIQRTYFENRSETVLVVTQKKEVALAYIQSHVNVKDLMISEH